MKVMLELLEDAANLLEEIDDLERVGNRTDVDLREVLERISTESARLLRSIEESDEAGGDARDGRRRLLEQGLAALAHEEFDEAESLFQDGVEEHPDDVEMLNHLALTHWERENFEQAAGWYQRGMEAGLAEAESASGSSGLELSEAYFRAVEGRALSLSQTGRTDEAIELFDALGRLAPENYAGCFYLAGELLHTEGRIDEAVEAYQRAPNEPAVHYNLGLARWERGDPVEAAADVIRGLSTNPHIAGRLLDEGIAKLSGVGGYLGSSAYAAEFLEAGADLWQRTDGAVELLRRCFNDERVREHLEGSERKREWDLEGSSADNEVDGLRGLARRVVGREQG